MIIKKIDKRKLEATRLMLEQTSKELNDLKAKHNE